MNQPLSNATQCSTCRHFLPDDHNPDAAMGRCLHAARHGYWFAGEWHRCRDHEGEDDAADQA